MGGRFQLCCAFRPNTVFLKRRIAGWDAPSQRFGVIEEVYGATCRSDHQNCRSLSLVSSFSALGSDLLAIRAASLRAGMKEAER
jgi:hypothetical protein